MATGGRARRENWRAEDCTRRLQKAILCLAAPTQSWIEDSARRSWLGEKQRAAAGEKAAPPHAAYRYLAHTQPTWPCKCHTQ